MTEVMIYTSRVLLGLSPQMTPLLQVIFNIMEPSPRTIYELYDGGHPDMSQAEIVGTGNANQFNDPRTGSNLGGTSPIGFDHILSNLEIALSCLAEAASGLSRSMCYKVGQNWKNHTH